MEAEKREFLEEAKESINPKDFETPEDYYNALETYTVYDREETDKEFSDTIKADAFEFFKECKKEVLK